MNFKLASMHAENPLMNESDEWQIAEGLVESGVDFLGAHAKSVEYFLPEAVDSVDLARLVIPTQQAVVLREPEKFQLKQRLRGNSYDFPYVISMKKHFSCIFHS